MQKIREISQSMVPEKARGIKDHSTFDLRTFCVCDKKEGEDRSRHRKVGEFRRGNMRKFLSVGLLFSFLGDKG